MGEERRQRRQREWGRWWEWQGQALASAHGNELAARRFAEQFAIEPNQRLIGRRSTIDGGCVWAAT